MMNVIILTHVELRKVCAIAFAYFFSIRNYSKIFSYKRTNQKNAFVRLIDLQVFRWHNVLNRQLCKVMKFQASQVPARYLDIHFFFLKNGNNYDFFLHLIKFDFIFIFIVDFDSKFRFLNINFFLVIFRLDVRFPDFQILIISW